MTVEMYSRKSTGVPKNTVRYSVVLRKIGVNHIEAVGDKMKTVHIIQKYNVKPGKK